MPASATPASAPRILCLHGGGTNSTIFRLQLRSFIRQSSPAFRFVFVEAPFLSEPHPAIQDYFSEYGPFKRWLRWLPHQEEKEDLTAATRIVQACKAAMEEDDKVAGGTGEWVGLLGFSQGATIVGSLLLAQQQADDTGRAEPLLGVRFRFGVIIAGQCPLVALSPNLQQYDHIAPVGHVISNIMEPSSSDIGKLALTVPTVHVHGLKDPALKSHRVTRENYCSEEATRLVEWDGDHELPVNPSDVAPVLEKMYELAETTGVSIVRPTGPL